MATEQINKHCVFCHPDTTTNPHFKPFGKADLAQVTLFGTDHIFVKPDLLPGRPDGLHFLMIPKPHQFSFASLPHYQNEVGGLIHRIEKVFGHPFVFLNTVVLPRVEKIKVYIINMDIYMEIQKSMLF